MKHAYSIGLHPGVAVRGPDHPNYGKTGSAHPHSMPVRGIFPDGTEVDYGSQGEAAKDGFTPSKISMCINGHIKTHLGVKWMPLPQPPEELE